jgi:hypothetical protein
METATFRRWLIEQGCHFDTQHEGRGEGHGILTIRREGRTAELPLVGPQHELDPRSVRQVCEALGLALSDLPGPKGRV